MLNNNYSLTKSEIEIERTPKELEDWVNQITNETWASEERSKPARLRDGLYKQFFEEVRPLSIFVNKLYSGDSAITCVPVIGNQNYDAIIRNSSPDPTFELKIEITSTAYHIDHLLAEKINTDGKVFKTSTVCRMGVGTQKFTEVKPKAIDHSVVLLELFSKIKTNLEKKIDKNYDDYPILLVTFDECNAFWDWDEKHSDQNTLSKYIVKELSPLEWKRKFSSVYILGLLGRVLMQVPEDSILLEK